MTCLCKNPKPALMRGRDRKYTVVCMNCTRTGYKASCKTAAQFYWELATEPEKWADKEQPFPVLESQTTPFCTKPSTMKPGGMIQNDLARVRRHCHEPL